MNHQNFQETPRQPIVPNPITTLKPTSLFLSLSSPSPGILLKSNKPGHHHYTCNAPFSSFLLPPWYIQKKKPEFPVRQANQESIKRSFRARSSHSQATRCISSRRARADKPGRTDARAESHFSARMMGCCSRTDGEGAASRTMGRAARRLVGVEGCGCLMSCPRPTDDPHSSACSLDDGVW